MTIVEIAEFAGPVLTILGVYGRIAYRFGHQDAELKRQSDELKWQSLAIIQMTKKTGSVPPPRGKLMTLDEPLEK